MVRFALRRVLSGVVVLLIISYLSFLAQDFAHRSRFNQPSPLGEMVLQAGGETVAMWRGLAAGDLGFYEQMRSYYSPRAASQLDEVLGEMIIASAALLLLAMILGGLVGGAIGMVAAATRRPGISLGLLLFSIVGISTPSFFLGMLLQYLEITLYRTTGLRLVPVGGFGWDSHLVLPVLVLAARPIAQIARLTYVRVSAILDEDYVRTARAKGLRRRGVWAVHIIRNAANSILTAMGASLRFSLSSLPVVEFLFGWPGAGKAMLDMLRTAQRNEATVIVLVMGAIFVAVNIVLDLVYQILDPRLRGAEAELRLSMSWVEWLRSLVEGLWRTLSLRRWRERRRAGPPLASLSELARATGLDPEDDEPTVRRLARRQAWLRALAHNPALLLGVAIGALLLVVVIAGPVLAPPDLRVAIGQTIVIDGFKITPPAPPSAAYPLGTDAQGRDIGGLLLLGARRTLMIALFAVVARLLLGGALGFLAGWFAGSRLDRTIMGLCETLAAFPSLLLAMLLVYAVGVRQGMISFVIALAFVGWGEVMQIVRQQVMAIRPMAYVESAVAAGLSEGQILSAHVLPNVWPTIVSLGFLEMGGVLMILGELGFLGVFIGGGFAAQGDALPELIYYDVPEWSVMLANSWRTFRSFPWATLYPALAFFVAILGFTFLGEGLRQLTERLTLSLRTLFNRYTFAAALVLVVGVNWMFQSTGFYARLAPSAEAFESGRAIEDIRHLAGEPLNGRLSGTADADRAAEWIAGQFQALGLQGAGEELGYFQTLSATYRNLTQVPRLVLHGPNGEVITAEYGQDFIRESGPYDVGGIVTGTVDIVAHEPSSYNWYNWTQRLIAHYGLSSNEVNRADRVVMRLTPESLRALYDVGHSGIMSVFRGARVDGRYELPVQASQTSGASKPAVWVSQALADRLLVNSGHTVDELTTQLPLPGEDRPLYVPTGWTANLQISLAQQDGEPVRNVLAYWPGEDIALDAEAIMVAAHYDGLGRFPDGTLYPGANDNASGVATMIEMIRTLKAQGFRPKRTIIFAAWCGGERHEPVDFGEFLRAQAGFSEAYRIVAGLEIEGVGAGTGSSAVVWRTSREQLTQALLQAARTVRTPVSTREQGLHADPQLWPDPPRSAPSAVISWAGSDRLAHRSGDRPEMIDPAKIGAVGRMVTLATMVLASDPAYQQ